MRKKLSAGVLLVLGCLGALQAQAQTVVHDAVRYVKDVYDSAKLEIFHRDVTLRDLEMLLKEAQQLQIAVNNAKRASPKLWDDSLNVFENIANGNDQIDSILNATSDFGDALKRAGCLNGVISGATSKDGVGGKTLAQVDFNPNPKPDELIAARKRNELEGRCQRLIAGYKTKQEVQDAAKAAAENTEDQKNPSSDQPKGMQATLDHILAAMNAANAQAMQNRLDALDAREADEKRAVDELERQRSMHDRLMKAPSSSKKVEARNPTLTIDPSDY